MSVCESLIPLTLARRPIFNYNRIIIMCRRDREDFLLGDVMNFRLGLIKKLLEKRLERVKMMRNFFAFHKAQNFENFGFFLLRYSQL